MKKLLFLLLLILGLLVACMPDYDNAIDAENDNSVPPPPQELKLTAISLQAKVNGTFVYDYVNAKGIVFERRLKAIGEFTPVDTFETADSVETFTDSTSLDYSTVYEYRLFAYNDNGISNYLDTSEITTGIAPDIIAPVIEMLYPLTDSLTVGVSEIVVSFSLTDLSIIGAVSVNDSTTIYDSTEARYNYLLTLSEGKNSFTILAKDEFENASTKTFLEIYYEPTLLDEAAPLLSDYMANARSFEDSIVVETIGTSITLSGMVTDASGIASVIVNDSLAAISNNNWLVTVEVGKNSYKEVIITATDASINGNSTTNTVYILNEIDSIAPTVSIISHKDSAIVTNSTITLSGKIFDNSGISTMSYRGTEAVITDSIWTLEVKDITESSFDKIVVQTRDNSLSQNLSKDTIHIMYDPTMLDSVAPVITVESHNKIDTVENSYTDLSLIVTDEMSEVMYVNINGERAAQNGVSWTYNITNLIKNTNNIIEIEAMDKSTNGNITKDTITLFYYFDNQKPTLTVSYPTDSLYITDPTVEITGSVTDASGIKEVLVNSTPVVIIGDSISTITLTAYDTWRSIQVIAIDNSPQQKRDTVTRWVRWDSTYYDHTKPTLTVISHDIDGTAKTGDDFINISGKAFDGSDIREVKVNGNIASYDPNDSTWTAADVEITNGDGVETPIVVVAVDNSAHANEETLEFNIVFEDDLIGNGDDVGPDIDVFHNGNPIAGYKTINTDNANLVGVVNDPSNISEFKVSINSGSETDISLSGSSWSESFTFTKYANEMVFRAKDGAENWTVETVIIYCDMNNPAPHLEYDLVGSTISWNWSKESGIDFDRYLIWTSTNAEPITGSAPSYSHTGMTDTTYSYTIDLADDNWLVVAVVDSAQDTIFSQMKNCAQGIPDGMVLVDSKDESFGMGTDDHSSYEKPYHQVSFAYSYFMDTTEVTQKKYNDIMSAYYPGIYMYPSWITENGMGDNYPANMVSWYNAALYCNAKSKMAGLDTVYLYSDITTTGINSSYKIFLESLTVDYAARGFRLPTEAEWEFACRAGTTTDYYWERDHVYSYATDTDTSEAISHAIWHENSYIYGYGAPEYGAQQVASKPHNAFGLYDMIGNVREWCNDWFSSNYDGAASSDSKGPPSGIVRSYRGASWASNMYEMRSNWRVQGKAPHLREYFTGFRPVLPVEIPVSWQNP